MSGSALIFYNLMAKKHIDRAALIATIRELKELSNEQKSDILQLISEQKKYQIYDNTVKLYLEDKLQELSHRDMRFTHEIPGYHKKTV